MRHAPSPSVALFNKLGWIPFYEQHKIDKCIIMYKRINGYLPNYLNEHLILNNKRINTRYSSVNAVCPKYRRETEGGRRSFAVSATRLWNSTPIEIRKLDSVACFKKNMFVRNNDVCIILSFNRILLYFKCLYFLAYNIY